MIPGFFICKDDFNQAKFNKYNVHVQPIVIFKISYKKKVMGTAYHVGFNFCYNYNILSYHSLTVKLVPPYPDYNLCPSTHHCSTHLLDLYFALTKPN
jgi:hypothetical protein